MRRLTSTSSFILSSHLHHHPCLVVALSSSINTRTQVFQPYASISHPFIVLYFLSTCASPCQTIHHQRSTHLALCPHLTLLWHLLPLLLALPHNRLWPLALRSTTSYRRSSLEDLHRSSVPCSLHHHVRLLFPLDIQLQFLSTPRWSASST